LCSFNTNIYQGVKQEIAVEHEQKSIDIAEASNMNEKLSRILAELRRYFEALYGERLMQLVLYGSQARGDAKPDSDIDVLVILKEPVDAWKEIDSTGEFIADLCLEYNIVISRNFVSLARFQQENSPFFINVRREGVLV
jgi:predicted nucleotidyltransferase